MHAIIQGGFLSSRMRELDEGLARELGTFTTNLVASGGEAAKSQAALETLNELLVRGWRHLIGTADDTKSQFADRNRRTPRPVPADPVRVFRGRKKTGVRRDIFVEHLGQLFMPFTVQMQRQYGLTAYLPAVLPESKESTIPDEVALVFYRTQQCYHEAKRSVGGRAYNELHELVFDMPASRSGFPKLLAADEITPDQPYHLFERSIDWQNGYCRLFVGTRKADVTARRLSGGRGEGRPPGAGGPTVTRCSHLLRDQRLGGLVGPFADGDHHRPGASLRGCSKSCARVGGSPPARAAKPA